MTKKYLKAILWGVLGTVVAAVGTVAVVAITGYIYGIFVSLLAVLAGAHAVHGYLGKSEPSDFERRKLLTLAIIFSGLSAVLPYLMMGGFALFDLIFIAIGIFAGYEYVNQLGNKQEQQIVASSSSHSIPGNLKAKIFFRKLLAMTGSYVIWIAAFLIIGSFSDGTFGVSWTIAIILIIYEAWKEKIWVITDKDLMSDTASSTEDVSPPIDENISDSN